MARRRSHLQGGFIVKFGNILKKTVAAVLAAVSMSAVCVTASAAMPAPTSEFTVDNTLKVLKTYDHDSYYFVKYYLDNNMFARETFPFWWNGASLVSGMDVGVHETYHGYTNCDAFSFDTIFSDFSNSVKIYAGNGVEYSIDHSKISGLFPTSQAVSSISSELKTFRYPEYVSATSTADANTKGVYGLVNEFGAYYSGLRVMSSLKPYFKKYDKDGTSWKSYYLSLNNDRTAYAEFKFWTLKYMLYAKKNKPEVYNAILNDKNYCSAYTAIETRFAALVKSENKWAQKNLDAKYIYEDSLCSDYKALTAELSKQSYKDMDKEIKAHADSSANYKKIAASQITSAKKTKSGVKLSWEKSGNADGYYIYRSTDGGKLKKVKTVSFGDALTWTDKKAKGDSVYAYVVKPFNRTGSGKSSAKVTAE